MDKLQFHSPFHISDLRMRFPLQAVNTIQFAGVENPLIIRIESQTEGGIIGELLHLTRSDTKEAIGSCRIELFRETLLQMPTGLSDFWYRLKSTCGGIQTK